MNCNYVALFLVCCSVISLSKSEGDPRVSIETDPDPLFIGDSVKFICSVPEEDFSDNLTWAFENKDGLVVPSHANDDVIEKHDSKIFRKSYLIVANATEVRCIATLKSGETVHSSQKMTVNDVAPLPTFGDRCSLVEDVPRIILWRYDSYGYESRFWVPHVVTNSKIKLSDKVSNFRLVCQSKSTMHWVLNKYKFRPTSLVHGPCVEEVLEVNPISTASSREYVCSPYANDAKSSSVSLFFPAEVPPPTIVRRVYDNETMDAVESIVEVLDSSKAYGIGFGSTAGSLVMMIAILFLKKTLQRRRGNQQGTDA